MTWKNEKAEKVFNDFRDSVFDDRQDERTADFYARTVEIGVRLATIVAAGRGEEVVSVEDMEWGRDVSLWSTKLMLRMAGEYMAENQFADYGNRIVRFLNKKEDSVSRNIIHQSVGGSLKIKELMEVLSTLVESGRLVEIPSPPPEKGKRQGTPRYRVRDPKPE